MKWAIFCENNFFEIFSVVKGALMSENLEKNWEKITKKSKK